MLGHIRWDNYFRTQKMGQLPYDREEGMITFEHSRWENYIRTQQMGQLI